MASRWTADQWTFSQGRRKDVQISIREYRPSDQRAVAQLFRDGVREHIYPAFFKSMVHPDHVGVALSLSMAGYVLGGSSYFQALLFGAAWAGLIYFCCHEIYEGYLARRLGADMADIWSSYTENPDNGFWVAEADGREPPRVVGVVAVIGRRAGDNANGRVATGSADNEGGATGELSLVVVAFPWRRKKMGSQLTQRALDFCKERGFARLALDISSPQSGAASLLRKLGFVQTSSHGVTHANRLISILARITVSRMEKVL
ncbi:probable N-acetyltransferase camello isoform X1 [Entelurus aequoreus]|uniref:probable N-acetyltransferase camello isoform X1 n=1 Tax=Entelurus aequoreus TaxID=161455 RepID=UPI002B1E5316|nr:probable N-acetyltransferase camello isoform X1 [Entelurus aequoreus]